MKYIFILFVFISLIISSQTLEFAEFLFNDGDYYRAITELKRILYDREEIDSLKILNLIGVCYYNMEDYDNAMLYFNRIRDIDVNANRNMLITLFKLKEFEKIVEIADDNNDYVILSKLFMDKYKNVFDYNNEYVDSIIKGYFKIGKKNAFLAGLFSAIIPGAGRMYSGRVGDGIFSMFTVLLPAGATYFYYRVENKIAFYISASITALFYLGDIYGAIVSAKQYFPAYKDVYYEKVFNNYNDTLFSLHYSFQ